MEVTIAQLLHIIIIEWLCPLIPNEEIQNIRCPFGVSVVPSAYQKVQYLVDYISKTCILLKAMLSVFTTKYR